MDMQEIDKEFYRLALLEVECVLERKRRGRNFSNKEAYRKLVELLFIKKLSLNTACNNLGMSVSAVRKLGFIFLMFRPVVSTKNQGNKLRKRYETSYKIQLIERLLSGESYQSITIDTDIPYTTLSKWVNQYKAGAFTLDNASGFKTR